MLAWKRLSRSKIIWPLITLGILMLFNLFFTPNFFRIEMLEGHLFGNLIDILKNGAPIMILAIGLTLVIATHGIDISVGSVVAISAGVVAMLIGGDLAGNPKYPIAFAMGAALVACIAAGMWNGMLVSWIGMQPIIATLILFVAGRGIAMVTTNAMVIWLYAKPFALLGQGYLFGLPFSLYIVAFLLLATYLVTRRTAVGMFIEAVGINPKATRFAGINARGILFWCYAFSGLCAGVSGLVVCSTVMSADGNNAGNLAELDAILAVVLGGTSLNGGRFFLLGSMVGALIIQTLTTTIYAFNVAPEIAQVVKALVVYAVSLLQSETFRARVAGMFARREVAA
ncbi:MAG: sugar ABC transporter permease [Spirochaetes bacterium RBG_16_67_19]|nr:MAG: sugar ABC transporter permease [Spirochaetes bacterium GWB1_66_5]OHD74094.1 MAG: sugar ABC transporter permease [Spirochaetes bacterium RBG_16_67_19]